MESIAVAKSLADKNSYEINTNQELAGVQLAVLLDFLFHRSAPPCISCRCSCHCHVWSGLSQAL